MGDWRLWAILILTVGGITYNVISHYAVRGNELKHLKEAIAQLKDEVCRDIKSVVKRIERLEDRLFNNK